MTVSRKNLFQWVIDSPLVLALAAFVLSLGPRLLNLAVFVGPDEFYWLTGCANFAQAFTSGDLTKTYHAGQPGVTLMWVETLGAWLRYGLQGLAGSADWTAIINSDKTMAMLNSERQVVAVVNALLVVFIVLLVRQVFGAKVGWLTGFLLAFDPFFLSESRVLRTEGLAAGFSTIALISLLVYLQKRRLVYAVLSGFLTGLALLSKITALSLLPVGVVVMAYISLDDAFKLRWRDLLVWGSVLLLTVMLLWPALWVMPGNVIGQMYDFTFIRAVEEDGRSKSFFFGAPYDDPGFLFYPVVLLYRTGLWPWLGLVLLGVMLWPLRRVARRDKIGLGIMVLYLVFYLALITVAKIKYDRYIVPILPTLTIMAAVGAGLSWTWLVTRLPRVRPLGWLMMLLILVGQIALTLPHHPYYYTFWNPLLGGPRAAAHVLPVGTGGEGIDQIATYLNTLPNAEKLTVATASSQKIEPFFKGRTIAMANIDGKWVQADYVMIYISQSQRGKHDDEILDYLERRNPVYTLNLHGLEYAWLYPGPAAQYYGGGYKLEGRGTLFGYTLGQTNLAAGDSLSVTLYWRNEGQQESDRFFVRLMDMDGYVWAEAVAQPRPDFEAASRQANAMVESEANLTLPVGIPPGDYFLKFGFRAAAGEIIGYFELPGDAKPLPVLAAKSYLPAASFQPAQPIQVAAHNDLLLLGYDLSPKENSTEPAQWVTLYWQALTDVTHDYVILLRLLNKEGQEAAYWLGRPVRSGYPTNTWRAGQIVQDPWLLTLPPPVNPGVYRLEIAIFDAASEQEVTRQIIGQIEY